MTRRWRVLYPLAGLLLLAGCKARQPGRVETVLMSTIKQRVTIRGSEKNPVEATPQEIESGRKTFGQYCMVCHGLDGQNTGVPFADRMSPPVPDLGSPQVQKYSDGQLNGIMKTVSSRPVCRPVAAFSVTMKSGGLFFT
jgi:cytochrome c553